MTKNSQLFLGGSMHRLLMTSALVLGAASGAYAGGIDRSGQPIDIIFKDGNYAELSFARTNPNVSGNDIAQAPPGFPIPYSSGQSYNDVADSFDMFRFGLKYQINEKFSVAFTGGEDYGVDIQYPESSGSILTGDASLLGGTTAIADSYTLSLIGRYHLNDNLSFHGGVRRQTSDGQIALGGLAYGRLNGYGVELDSDSAWGYLVGAAYEKPEIALRVALTYYSKITHKFGTTETLRGASLGPSEDTETDIPQAINLDFQTGIAEDTLLFAQVRWVDHSQFTVNPSAFQSITPEGTQLVSLDDSTTYTIGVGRRFTDEFSASIAYIYDDVYGDDLVSPLAPTHGSQALRIGASYMFNDNVELSAGLRYTWLGDALAETGTPDVARADFSDNEAISFGMKVGFYF